MDWLTQLEPHDVDMLAQCRHDVFDLLMLISSSRFAGDQDRAPVDDGHRKKWPPLDSGESYRDRSPMVDLAFNPSCACLDW
jgi:hypothetical protein